MIETDYSLDDTYILVNIDENRVMENWCDLTSARELALEYARCSPGIKFGVFRCDVAYTFTD